MWPWAATPPPHFLSFFPSPISSLYHLQAGLISYSQSKKSLRYPCKIFISKGVAFPTWLFLTFLLDLHHMLPYLNFKSLKEADPTAFNNSISWAGYNSHNIVNQLHLGLKKKHFFFFFNRASYFCGSHFLHLRKSEVRGGVQWWRPGLWNQIASAMFYHPYSTTNQLRNLGRVL